jgi:hypothetical protein
MFGGVGALEGTGNVQQAFEFGFSGEKKEEVVVNE